MALYKIKDIYANPAEKYFDGHDITSFSVYAMEGGEQKKVGGVKDLLLDESGRFRYFAVDTGLWVFGKTVLLPVGYIKVDYDNERLYATRLTKEQVENLPEYSDDMVVDEPYETTVYNAYAGSQHSAVNEKPVDVEVGTHDPTSSHQYSDAAAATGSAGQSRYARSPETYSLPKDDDRIRLYEERLVAEKRREKTGDVTVGKSVETSTEQVSIPVQKEKVVIEVSKPTSTTPAAASATSFQDTDVAKVELHQDVASAHKDVQLRETVKVRKEVEQETKTFRDQIRHEELDVDSNGTANVEMRDR